MSPAPRRPRLVLDGRVLLRDGGRTLIGGDPPRVLRLSDRGEAALTALIGQSQTELDGETEAQMLLFRRLVDDGLAHPRPDPAPTSEVTAIVPARDRTEPLARCLAALAASRPGRIIVVDDGSADAEAIAGIAERHGAELVRRDRADGPAAARNTGLSLVRGETVAFVDSDCVLAPGAMALLCGALTADPDLGAVAPRILPMLDKHTLGRYADARSPLDLGPAPALVRPGGRVAYVPAATLVARREALGDGFDERLRHGEDVDLVWRMRDEGWRVRYEPSATAAHFEPVTLRGWLHRRYRYGTAAGPLARRHPTRLAPVVVHPRLTAVIACAAAGRPGLSLGALGLHCVVGTRALADHGVGRRDGLTLVLRGVLDVGVAAGRATTMLAPGLLAAGLTRRRSAPAALAALLGPPLVQLSHDRPRVGPVAWAALSVADDLAYGAGVWTGSLRARTPRALLPRRAVAPEDAGKLS